MGRIMLETLFDPKSVAVIGASRSPEKIGSMVLHNLIEGGFSGTIVPINPFVSELGGLACYPSLRESGVEIELSVVAVPRDLVEQAVRDSVASGAKSIIILSSGFRESGEEGRRLEEKLVDFCLKRRVRLVGPNCLGLMNTHGSLNCSFLGPLPPAGNVAILSQSGALCSVLVDLAMENHLGLSRVISMGNKGDVSGVDLLRNFADDTTTGVIVGYIEDISSGDELVKAAEEASSRKPVVFLKSGTTEVGQRAAASHTGIMSNPDVAYGAAFRQSGLVQADSFDELLDYAKGFSMQPVPQGDRILVISNAGGPGTMAADAVEKAGMRVVEVVESLDLAGKIDFLGAATVNNPVNVLGDASPALFADVLRAGLRDGNVDGVVVLLTPQSMSRAPEVVHGLAEAADGTKPVMLVIMGGRWSPDQKAAIAAAGLPEYTTPERAVKTLRAMLDYSRWRNRPPRIVNRFRVHRRRVERIISRSQRVGQLQLSEVKSKAILKAYGFRIPEGYMASSADEAVEIGHRLGFPLAMKIVSPDVIHKSDLGGVKLDVANGQQVRDSYDLMMLRIAERVPDARIEGIYVEKMLDRGLEVILGMNRDPQFGPMLMFGLGGIFVEVMDDVAFHLAPITYDEAMQMLLATRSYEMLEGKRGHKEVDTHAVAVGLQRISQLTTDFPQIQELDINPFIVGDMGFEPVVADARMRLSEPL